MSCIDVIQTYGLRSIGLGERLLPRSDFTLCDQFVLIGSGMVWNLYFGIAALFLGFFASIALACARNVSNRFIRKPADWFIFFFRGSPLFIQFFFFYEAFTLLPREGLSLNLGLVTLTADTSWLTRAWAGALIVLFLNTTAYAGEIFYGALRSVPKGDLEAADAYGFSGWKKFRHITFPTMLRLGWPAYTNEAIFLFHATTLVYFSSFPARQQKGDALYYANYFADKTFNPFIPYPILAMYFILLTVAVVLIYGAVYRRLNRHLPSNARRRLRPRPAMLR
ncbi:ABC transporter permease subunit [Pseudooceanicola sediminis]|uniref:ABC transporter permease subunit n=1 Tax=Pseudooceanicola sediminis TaxID=2211117 RepID=A0A399IZE8_9RHOB|nr:ABC transporter permease subunit [Pseudooceanicola sediminis]KAA2313180.1 ABC transporter permease subunit [Puniceibacterium sp. HSS470]RII37827.1 ABC transporter permease subunit [Pseudooceanicola sediminis]|tara:strand:- start:40553 stop:41392 length:840 start_codon:yes stop_codon:yes gene_type:complete